MKYTFACSMVNHGLIGGGLILDEESVTYRTGKLTIEPRLRNLVLPLEDIESVSWKNVVFPIATFTMKNGEEYRFLIFNRMRFERAYWDIRG